MSEPTGDVGAKSGLFADPISVPAPTAPPHPGAEAGVGGGVAELGWGQTMANAIVAQANRNLAKARLADAARPIGTRALERGIADYRKKPDPDIHATDWAVWLVEWDGRGWRRLRRLTSGRGISLSETYTAIDRHAQRLGVQEREQIEEDAA